MSLSFCVAVMETCVIQALLRSIHISRLFLFFHANPAGIHENMVNVSAAGKCVHEKQIPVPY